MIAAIRQRSFKSLAETEASLDEIQIITRTLPASSDRLLEIILSLWMIDGFVPVPPITLTEVCLNV